MDSTEVVLILGKRGSGKTTLAKKMRAGYTRVITLDPLLQYGGTVVTSFDGFAEIFKNDPPPEKFDIVCRFQSDTDHDYMFRAVREIGNCMLVVEEAGIFIDPRSQMESFSWLVNYGRHREISMICISRRVPELSIQFRSQINRMITFRQTEPPDLKTLEAYGFDPVQVSNLPDHEYLAKEI